MDFLIFLDKALDITCKNTDQIFKIKEQIRNDYFGYEDKRYDPNRQRLFNGFFLLEDHLRVDKCIAEDGTLLLSLEKSSRKNNHFNTRKDLSVHRGFSLGRRRFLTTFENEKDMFLLHGTSQNFQCLLLRPDKVDKIKLKSDKFGIIYHIEGDVGNRIFQGSKM